LRRLVRHVTRRAMSSSQPLSNGVTCETVSYGGWPNCQRITNGSIELVVTTDVGPRVLRCGFVGGPNLFFEAKEDLGQTGGDEWRPFGGHRLWHAPEEKPRTYVPDNAPIKFAWDRGSLTVTQPVEKLTGIQKEMVIRLDAQQDRVEVTHRLTNRNLWEITTAPWCLTVMAAGGRAILPHEPFVPFPDQLLPARPLVLWSYTDMTDPRWTWGSRYIELRQQLDATCCQKIGIYNTLGWGAYEKNGVLFLKHAAPISGATYPDFGCNWEVYTNPEMLELETLGPLQAIAPGATAEHVETWVVAKQEISGPQPEWESQLSSYVGLANKT